MPEGRPGSTAILTRRAPARSKAGVIEREAQQNREACTWPQAQLGQPQMVNGHHCSRGASSRRRPLRRRTIGQVLPATGPDSTGSGRSHGLSLPTACFLRPFLPTEGSCPSRRGSRWLPHRRGSRCLLSAMPSTSSCPAGLALQVQRINRTTDWTGWGLSCPCIILPSA